MRLSESVVIAAPKGAVWEYLADLDNYLDFLAGITRWERDGEQASGLGARRRMLIRVGSAEVGGLIEIVEWDALNDLAWSSVTGVDQRGRLRLRDVLVDVAGRHDQVDPRPLLRVAQPRDQEHRGCAARDVGDGQRHAVSERVQHLVQVQAVRVQGRADVLHRVRDGALGWRHARAIHPARYVAGGQ